MKGTYRIPSLPNFLTLEVFSNEGVLIDRREGVSVATMTPREVRSVGRRWTAAFLRHVEAKRRTHAKT